MKLKNIPGYLNLSFKKKISKILFRIRDIRDNNASKISEIRGIHKGKRAFIICNGPSLKAKDLDKIEVNQDISFASNKIDKFFTQTKWRPTYYTVMDEGYQYRLLETMNTIPAKIKFFRKESFITTRKVKGNCIFIDTNGDRKLLKEPMFSENCTEVLYTIATVTYAMLQLAVHMGIKEIYIIGCDNAYGIEKDKDGNIIQKNIQSYFEGSNQNDVIAVAIWEMNIAYQFARKYADAHGIKIYNATRGGYLEVFERVEFDTLF